jgi:hypothetical protein
MHCRPDKINYLMELATVILVALPILYHTVAANERSGQSGAEIVIERQELVYNLILLMHFHKDR